MTPTSDQFAAFFARGEESLERCEREVRRGMAAIADQLDRGHLSDKAVAEGILGVLNHAAAAIAGTQEAIEEFHSACERAGMLPERKSP